MKRLLGLLLALVMLVTCAGCGGGDKPADKPAPAPAANEQSESKIGALMPIGLDEEGYKRWTKSVAEVEGQTAYTAPNTVVFFDNMNSMIAALQAKQIDRFSTSSRVGNYIAAHNDALKVIDNNFKPVLGYSIGMLEKDAAQIEEINTAIKAMKDDGTIDKLIKENITDVGNGEPAAMPMPVIDGAPTIKVAVTGDMPAMDFMTADGKPAGFNVAFLSELSKRINKNIELVDVDAGARSAALSSGQVDALFWVIGVYDQEGNALPYPLDNVKGFAVSVPYLMDSRVGVTLK
ncbi:MAG: transporter substrate-binding domain-containing protein [Selenomonadaceae bacterium]|nr:transporter substrate-binding domain-containing protein [Selenomonadaceae bacterium]